MFPACRSWTKNRKSIRSAGVNASGARLLWPDDEITEWFGAGTDITQRIDAEQARRESDRKFRVLFDSIDKGFCTIQMIKDASGTPIDFVVLEVNEAYQRQTGPEDVVGKLASEIFPRMEEWLAMFAGVALSGEAARLEYQVEQIGRWYTAFVSPVGAKGSLQLSFAFNDITERKRAEQVLREREERQTFLLGLSDALRVEHEDDAIGHVATRLIGDQLDVDRCYIVRLSRNAVQPQ